MKKIILISILFCLFLSTNANDSDTVKYRLIINDPYNIPKTGISFSPVDIFAGPDIMVMWNLGVNTMIKNRIVLSGMYSRVYTKKIFDFNYAFATGNLVPSYNVNFTHPGNPSFQTPDNLKASSLFEAGLGLVISDKEKIVNEMINLRSVTGANLIVHTVTNVDTRIRKLIVLRGGLKGYGIPLDIASKLDNDEYVEANDGTRFYNDGIQFSDINYSGLAEISQYDKGRTMIRGENGGWYTNLNSTGYYFGISRQIIRNMAIDAEGYGKRVKSNCNSLYFDVLYAPVKIDDLTFFRSNPSATIIGDEIGTGIKNYTFSGSGANSIKTNNLGFRIGLSGVGLLPGKFKKWEDRDEITKTLNTGYRMEAGLLPGIKGRGFFFSFTMFFQLAL